MVHRKKFSRLFILVGILSLCACQGVELISNVKMARSLSGKAAFSPGYYELIRVKLTDMSEGTSVNLEPHYSGPIELDSGKGIFYHGIVTNIRLNSQESYLAIRDEEGCAFHWEFKSRNSDVDVNHARIGRMRVAGDMREDHCIEGNYMKVPKKLLPFTDITLSKAGDLITMNATDGTIKQELYFQKINLEPEVEEYVMKAAFGQQI